MIACASPPGVTNTSTSSLSDFTSIKVTWDYDVNSTTSRHFFTTLTYRMCGELESTSSQLPGSITTAYLRNLSPNATYCLQLSTMNSCAVSPYVYEANVTLPADDVDPRIKSLMTHEVVLTFVILLAWMYLIYFFFKTWGEVSFVQPNSSSYIPRVESSPPPLNRSVTNGVQKAHGSMGRFRTRENSDSPEANPMLSSEPDLPSSAMRVGNDLLLIVPHSEMGSRCKSAGDLLFTDNSDLIGIQPLSASGVSLKATRKPSGAGGYHGRLLHKSIYTRGKLRKTPDFILSPSSSRSTSVVNSVARGSSEESSPPKLLKPNSERMAMANERILARDGSIRRRKVSSLIMGSARNDIRRSRDLGSRHPPLLRQHEIVKLPDEHCSSEAASSEPQRLLPPFQQLRRLSGGGLKKHLKLPVPQGFAVGQLQSRTDRRSSAGLLTRGKRVSDDENHPDRTTCVQVVVEGPKEQSGKGSAMSKRFSFQQKTTKISDIQERSQDRDSLVSYASYHTAPGSFSRGDGLKML